MKLMSVITTLNPVHGGPVECAIQLNKNLTAKGHTYDIVTLDPPEAPWNKNLSFEPICLGRASGNPDDLLQPALLKFLKQNQSQYDGSIFHGIWTVPTVAMRFAWDGKHPYVVFSHGMLDPYFIRNFPIKHIKKSLFYRTIAAPVLSRAVATLFTCEEELRLANTSYRPTVGNRMVVRYGINPPTADPAQYEGRLTPLKETLRDKDVILFLGRIHPKKGCDILIEAAARIAAQFPRAHLLIAGPDQTGSVEQLQRLAASRGIADKLTWIGPVYGDERWFLYNLADVFILPSHMENFGLTVAESLSQGRPVLISDKVNIYSSILKAGAGFVAADTVDGTVRLLEHWCSLPKPERELMGAHAKQLFEREFQAKHTADDVLRAFEMSAAIRN
jgi:glycosyltransferase involved in cell wall biosynthesis